MKYRTLDLFENLVSTEIEETNSLFLISLLENLRQSDEVSLAGWPMIHHWFLTFTAFVETYGSS